MGLAEASVTVVAAGAIGGGFRLMLYPQFVIGMTLTIASVVLKLSRHAAGLGILLLVSLTLGAVLAANSDRIKRLAVRWSPWLWRQAVEGVRGGTEMIGKGLSNTPPHVFTTALFLLPAIGQFLGSMATVRMLSNLNLSPQAIPGSQAMTVSSGLYLFTLVTGFSKPWLTPQKVSFVLQTVWLLAAMFSSSGGDLEIKQYLPSVLAGWGSLFLSMTPASALVHAAKSATASALVAAASVATIHGVAAITPGKENPQDTPLLEGEHDTLGSKSSQVEYDSENSESLNDLASEEESDRLQRTATSKSEAIVASSPDLITVLESWRDRFDERAIAAWFATTFSRENAVQVLDSFRNKSRKEKRRSSRKQSVFQNELAAEMEEDALELEEEARGQGFDITSLSPPMSVAVPVTLFRAFPTLLALIVGVSLGVLKMVQGDFKPAMLAIPVLLAPLALGEFITVARKFGLRALLTWKLSPPDTASDEVNDGLSLLMWQSPTMLEAWQLVNTVEDSNELIDSIKEAPGRYFNPSEATIAATPPLTRRIVFELCVSILIDVIGAATYTIPFVGELADLIWAPIQGLLVQYLYRMPMLSWIGVAEEILPFTDLLPTATIGWFYQYWKFLPVWAILIARDIRDSTFRKPKAE